MSWDDGSLDHSAAKQARTMIAPHGDGGLAPGPDWADLRSAARWLEGRGVAALGVALIAASIAWKAQFLGHLYFRQDDFHLLDRAFTNPLSWKELTFIGAGHLIPGPYLIAWLVTRISLYDWGLASAVLLAFVAAAGLAALRLLRTLFGDRPTILIPLVYYLLCPLTVPDLGIWSSALESLPLQLAIFSALNAQVRYVSTQRVVHLLSAVFWVAFGMFFFEKGLVVPLLLFAITSGFLMGEGPWLANARRCASRYWKAWLIYAIEIVGYSVLLKVALKTSLAQPAAPRSASPVLMFVDTLVRQTLLPGAVGGPWHWFTTIDASYAFAAAPATLTWLSLIIAGLVVVGSILHSRTAWRSWAIFGMWVVGADIFPVIIGRVAAISPMFNATVLGLESRYVADAVAVLAICIGLAFWPLAAPALAHVPSSNPEPAGPVPVAAVPVGGQLRRTVATVLIGAFAASSIWSVQAYESVTTGGFVRTYIANARLALRLAPRGTVVVNAQVPPFVELGTFGTWANASTVIGDMARGESSARLRWIATPEGTFDHLMIFGADGRLHLAQVYGTGSPLRSGRECWKARNGHVAVPFLFAAPSGTRLLRFGYLLYSRYPGEVTVHYGASVRTVQLESGLHGEYLPESGPARRVVISWFAPTKLCVGDAEAGILVPSATGQTIPAIVP